MKWMELVGTDILLKKLGHLRSEVDNGNLPFLLAGDLRVMIERRNKHGQGLLGAFKQYSQTPYYRNPKDRPQGKGGRRQDKRSGRLLKSIAYDGGYKQFAALTKGGSTPNLSASGAMMRAFQPIKVNKQMAKLMFTRQREAFKALVNNADRRFVGATRGERHKLSRSFADLLNILTCRVGLT